MLYLTDATVVMTQLAHGAIRISDSVSVCILRERRGKNVEWLKNDIKMHSKINEMQKFRLYKLERSKEGKTNSSFKILLSN